MDKIGWGQLGIALALSRIFSEAANFPMDDITYGMQRFTVIILSFVLLAAALVPVMLLLKKYPGENIFALCAKSSACASRILAVIFIAVIFTMMVSVTVQLEFYTSSTIFDAAPVSLIIFFVLIVCLYALTKGLPAVVRTGVIVAGGFAALLILVVCGVGKSLSLNHLYPALIDSPKTLVRDVLGEFSKNLEAAVFAALCSNVREKAGKSLILYVSITLPVLLIMTFLYNCVLGEYLDMTGFPFYMLSSLSDITLFQRLDGIDVIVWVMAAMIRLSLMALAAESACRGAFKNARAAKITAAAVLAASALTSLALSRNTAFFTELSAVTGTGAALLLPATAVPLICLIFASRKKRKKEVNG